MTTVNLSCFAGAGAQFFDNNGVPLAGGLLYTYAAGTTTQTATYTTNSGSITNSNPIVLDSSGRVTNEIWLIAGTTYKFVLQTSAAVQIGSYDNIPGSNDYTALLSTLNGSSGSSNIGYSQGGTGAVSTTVQSKLRQSISVFDFMTSAQIADVQAQTLTQDVTSAIQAALAALPNDGGSNQLGELYFPPGLYKCSSTLTIYTGTVIRGVGAILNFATLSSSGTAINIVQVSSGSIYATDQIYGDPIGGLTLIGPGKTTSSIGVLIGNSSSSPANQVSKFHANLGVITGFGYGIQQANNSYAFKLMGGYVYNNNVNAYFPNGLSNNAEQVEFHGVTFGSSTTSSLKSIGNSLDIAVFGGSFDYDASNSIDVEGDTIVRVFGAHFENNPSFTFIKNLSSSGNPTVNLSACTFTTNGSSTPVIDGTYVNITVRDGWLRLSGSSTTALTSFVLSNNGYKAVVDNVQLVSQSGAAVTNWINGLGSNAAAFYTNSSTLSDFNGINGSFFGDQVVTLSGTTASNLAIPLPAQAKGAFLVCVTYSGNSGPTAVWAVASPDYGNTIARAVINSLASVGGLTTGETLSLTWPTSSNYLALSKSGSGWNGNYTVSVVGI